MLSSVDAWCCGYAQGQARPAKLLLSIRHDENACMSSKKAVRGAVKMSCELCLRQHDYLPGGRCGVGVAQLGRGGQHAVLVGRDLCAERERPYGVLAQLANVEQPHLPTSAADVSRLHAAWPTA